MRRQPYTAIGIRRVPCLRCGKPSAHQWNICSLPGYHGICADCDVALNRLVLGFMGAPEADVLGDQYAERMVA